jgi:CDP-glycerol glycerophosphotransferase
MTAATPGTPAASSTPTLIGSIDLSDGETPMMVLTGAGSPPAALELVGSRLRLTATIEATDAGWLATIPLRASRWGGPPMPPPAGRYRTGVGLTAAIALPEPRMIPGQFRVSFASDGGTLVAEFAAPLNDHEYGHERQAALEAHYRSTEVEPVNAVFFESFFGQNASCNPLAIDRALAAARPDIARYWGVQDASVAVPDGAIALIEGSEEWWRIRGSARLIVVNDWLRNRYRKRRGQKVLQTWHGTMLKKLALNRSRLRIRTALATLRERGRWDILLSQNRYATSIFRRAYAYFGAVWEEGYPRDDVLLRGDPDAVRQKLGIPSGMKVLLYAPTWRDDRPDHVDHLDVSSFTEALGEGYVTLIRGHSRTLQPGTDLHAGGVIDVTSYPDVSELFLAADALITDYSSVMFDFSVTAKPIYFFTPDLDRYREVLRGFYFDLIPVAPGPVVQHAAELIELVRNPAEVTAAYADKYAAWRRRFNPRDDGHAAERVVARLLRDGILK